MTFSLNFSLYFNRICEDIFKTHDPAIYYTKDMNEPLDRSNIWREMHTLCTAACVSEKKVFPHNLRHLFAKMFYSIDKDISRLSDILGHSSIDTTRIYIIESGAEHRKKMENMRLLI